MELLTTKELCAALKVSRATLKRWLASGRISKRSYFSTTGKKFGHKRFYLESVIEDLKHTVNGEAEKPRDIVSSRFYSVVEAARLCEVQIQTIYKATREGRLQAEKDADGNVRIKGSDLSDYKATLRARSSA